MEYNYAGVAALYKVNSCRLFQELDVSKSDFQDVLANTENSVDRLVELGQETYLCPR